MVQDVGPVLPVEVKVGVVGQIDHRGGVCLRVIGDGKRVVLAEAIAHRDLQRAGKAFLPVGTGAPQDEHVSLHAAGEHLVGHHAVEMVVPVVLRQCIVPAVQGKCRALNAVGIAPNHRAEVAAARLVRGKVVIAQRHVAQLP